MLCVVIQPYDYNEIHHMSDIKSVSVLRFSKFAMEGFEKYFDVDYEGELTDEIIEKIFNAVNDNEVVTYNKMLLQRCLSAIHHDMSEYEYDKDKIISLMQLFGSKHKNLVKRGGFVALKDALEYYDDYMLIDRDDPGDMTRGSFKLYRYMKKDSDFIDELN